ncbi:1210_t:CDS:2, partial [Racocetra persica]
EIEQEIEECEEVNEDINVINVRDNSTLQNDTGKEWTIKDIISQSQ